jgi:7-dehydrocholesterol reductase
MGKPAKPSSAAPPPRPTPSKTVHSAVLTYASMLSLLSLCPPFVILL